MKAWQIIVGLTAVTGIGALVFLASRSAAAAEGGKKAFKVAPDCSSVELVGSREEGEAAAKAAVIAAFRGTSEPAIDLMVRALGMLFPQCVDKFTDATTFSVPGLPGASLGTLRLMLMGRTVADLKDHLEAAPMPNAATWLASLLPMGD